MLLSGTHSVVYIAYVHHGSMLALVVEICRYVKVSEKVNIMCLTSVWDRTRLEGILDVIFYIKYISTQDRR